MLTGSTSAKERRQLLSDLADGQIRLLVGTHALIEESVSFHNLLLAVTDEQHRFGVRQRIKLGSGETAVQPHVLVMSATPIPRTLALILYSDLDISLIDQLPPGRQPIRTYTAVSSDRPRIEQIMRRQVQEGRQVYVVCPMIEEQADTDLKSAVSTYNRLAQQVFPDLRIGLLHGSLKTDAKDQSRPSASEIQIWSTRRSLKSAWITNANLMLIENAERFGLAQFTNCAADRSGNIKPCASCYPTAKMRRPVSGCGPFVDRKTVSKSRKKIWSCADPENFSAHANTVFRL